MTTQILEKGTPLLDWKVRWPKGGHKDKKKYEFEPVQAELFYPPDAADLKTHTNY